MKTKKTTLCCDVSTPKGIVCTVLKIAFGLSLILMGVANYMTMDGYKAMVSSDLAQLEPLGQLWAYILPGLLIIGGVCMIIKKYPEIGAWATTIALGSIPVGLLLKAVLGGVSTAELMPMINAAFIWIIAYVMVRKCCYIATVGKK